VVVALPDTRQRPAGEDGAPGQDGGETSSQVHLTPAVSQSADLAVIDKLPLASGVGLTATSLALPEHLPFEDWQQTGRTLARAAEGVMWWLGDWWRYGQHAYGDRVRSFELTGFAFQTCMNAGRVAGAVETYRRREVLTWSHHAEVAGLEPAYADKLLDAAEAEGWSRSQLRAAVKALKRRTAIAARPVAELSGAFPVIYADPPWRYEHAISDSRKIENQYPTMTAEELAALTPPAADDAVMFLWATSPKLDEALDLLRVWGFSYRTNLVWVKDKIGMGYYARQQHEQLLIARRGDLPVPDPADRPSSVIHAPRGRHSEKPESVYGLIERMYPLFARCEMFARQTRPGWTSWGNEIAAAS
jgi:N6-adenosine-specific RNA methylase IME4